jgi:radical SAM protein with 4Fe4S-binding SPASM domain
MEIKNAGFCTRYSKDNLDEILAEYLGPRYTEYRKAWYRATPAHIPGFPIHIDLELVDLCNQNCIFCARNKTTHPDLPYQLNTGAVLSDKHLENIFREAKYRGLYSVNFGFSEPLLHKDIFTIVRKFHEEGVIDSRMITNGLLLDRYIDDVFESGLVNLYISLDADSEETYMKIRGKGFHRVVGNVLALIEEKKRRKSMFPVLRVSFVEHDLNAHEVNNFKDFWGNKIDLIDIQFYQDFNKTKSSRNKKRWTCIDPFRRLSVTANGDILPCCTFYGKQLSVGNLEEVTLESAWKSDAMLRVRHNLLKDREPICLACQEC